METILVRLFNPHREDMDYPVSDIDSSDKIWRCYINPSQIEFMREVLKGDSILTQIGVGSRIFEIDCTLDALTDLINEGRDILVFKA